MLGTGSESILEKILTDGTPRLQEAEKIILFLNVCELLPSRPIPVAVATYELMHS